MPSPQSLSDTNRRLVAAWAADCAEHVVDLFELDAPDDDRPRDAIASGTRILSGRVGCCR
ncbi:putative immunity protein [Microbacterium lacticum]